MPVMLCPNCGKEIDEASQFCPSCGIKRQPEQPLCHRRPMAYSHEQAEEQKNISHSSLLQYLQSAISLETDLETQRLIIEDYEKGRNAIKPERIQKPLPEAPVYESATMDFRDYSSVFCSGLSVLMFSSMLIAELTADEYIGFWVFVSFLFVAASILWLFMAIRQVNGTKIRIMENNEFKRTDYIKNKTEIETENKQLSIQYRKNIQTWQITNDAMHEKFSTELAASEEVLNKLYALDFIYPKYRNLPALTSIYEYFMTGRCTALEGANGAYNLYENELRMNTVISQLSTIIENLEAIKQNQYMLYQQVKSMTDTVRAIHDEVSQIKGYTIDIAQLTTLNTYYSAVTARNAQIMTLCHIL